MRKLVNFFTKRHVIVLVDSTGTRVTKIRFSKREFSAIQRRADYDYMPIEDYILKAIKNYLEIA
jgi:predicted DNA binding CopG/RHH family protein